MSIKCCSDSYEYRVKVKYTESNVYLMAENCSYCHAKVEIPFQSYQDSIGRTYLKGLCPLCGRINRRYKLNPVRDEGDIGVIESETPSDSSGYELSPSGHEVAPHELLGPSPDELPSSYEGGSEGASPELPDELLGSSPDELPNSNEVAPNGYEEGASGHEGANSHELAPSGHEDNMDIGPYEEGFIDGYDEAVNDTPDMPSKKSSNGISEQVSDDPEEKEEDLPENTEEPKEESKGGSFIPVIIAVIIISVVVILFLSLVNRNRNVGPTEQFIG